MSSERPVAEMLQDLGTATAKGRPVAAPDSGALDRKTRALVGIGAAVSLGAPTSTYRELVKDARQGGATSDECIGAFEAAAPVAGAVRIVSGAPRLASALGYDVGRALE